MGWLIALVVAFIIFLLVGGFVLIAALAQGLVDLAIGTPLVFLTLVLVIVLAVIAWRHYKRSRRF